MNALFCFEKKYEVLEITGPDARDFLNRITSADFKNLEVGHWTPATVLNPMGKILLYFWALYLKPEQYFLLIPPKTDGFDEQKSASLVAYEILDRMFFRENLKLNALGSQWSWVRVLVDQNLPANLHSVASLSNAQIGTLDEKTYGIHPERWESVSGYKDLGLLTQTPEKWTDALKSSGFQEAADLEFFRILALDPAVPQELNLKTIPLEAHLNDAVHENKGCFPGQEVIERIRSMGQVPRNLVQLEGQGTPPSIPSAFQSLAEGRTQDAGTLTSVTIHREKPGTWIGLGFLKRVWQKPDVQYSLAGQPIEIKTKSS